MHVFVGVHFIVSLAAHLTTVSLDIIYVLDKALPRVLYGQYSTKRLVSRRYSVSRPIFECYINCIAQAKGSALSGIENVRLKEIHSSETIRNSPNVTGSAKTEHNSALQIFQYKALKYIG